MAFLVVFRHVLHGPTLRTGSTSFGRSNRECKKIWEPGTERREKEHTILLDRFSRPLANVSFSSSSIFRHLLLHLLLRQPSSLPSFSSSFFFNNYPYIRSYHSSFKASSAVSTLRASETRTKGSFSSFSSFRTSLCFFHSLTLLHSPSAEHSDAHTRG